MSVPTYAQLAHLSRHEAATLRAQIAADEAEARVRKAMKKLVRIGRRPTPGEFVQSVLRAHLAPPREIVCKKCGTGSFKHRWPAGAQHCGCASRRIFPPEERKKARKAWALAHRTRKAEEAGVPYRQRVTPEWAIGLSRAEQNREYKRRERRAAGSSPRLHDAHVRLRDKQKRPLHDAHVRALRGNDALYARWRTRTDPAFRLNQRLRVAIRKALRGSKGGRSWETFVGYTLAELVAHLMRTLPKGVTFRQAMADGWHIDHIYPKSRFNLADPEQLRGAWALSNLRLLPAIDNMRKGAKVISLL